MTTALLLLGKPPKNPGTNFYARNQLLAKNNIDNTQRTSPKVLAPNQGCSTIRRRSKGTNGSSGTSSDLRSWCISRNFRAITKPTLRKISLMKTSILSHANHSSWNFDDDFTAENGFWLQIALTTLSAPHQRCQHHIQGALPLKKNSERTNATSSASSYRRWWCTSRDLRPSTRSFLISLLGITNLQSLSPNKLDMPIFLINQMAFLYPTSNNTICDCTFMHPSKLFSSPMGSWLWRPQCQEAATLSLFQFHWVYKQANSSQIIQ